MTTTELRSSVLLIQSTVTAVSTTITTTRGYRVIFCDCGSNAMQINLPAASGNLARITIKKVDSKANDVTIDCAGGDNLDGGAQATLTTQYESVTLVSDNVNWNIV